MNAMNDIALQWQINGADIVINNADIALDDSLSTAVIISLFTDRRALDSDELPTGSGTDRRGWWGDSFNSRPIGSRLWLLAREKQLSAVLHRAKAYADEALAWLVDERHVRKIDVMATAPASGVLLLTVSVTLFDGSVLPLPFKTLLSRI
ncbi:putative bacteriophage protein [Xenorhabdus bovienii str. Jollieti]|uniref:Mu-like prophage FluMu protein n=1 Tax=Xenorhabdus bovienii (strain SS-2004) TaxID=406818 RepID=D3V7F3_XENBS|nr:phage GP46 family protein [Xenorhabdus bovienii]CBJ81765.1 Mu-like prophage FluMu protein [Xenorhabdus bovienii SS-2004]CDH27641.1 putative bacteriophage protein [Xenorhabdus bovienii str. Jollieti]